VFEQMRDMGIGVNVHYIPVHTQPYYSDLGFRRGDYPNAERYYDSCISLPMYPGLTDAEQSYVVTALCNALA
jgi:dTDP-4-amino-4,6-dideoxygalactose transaminase